MALSRREMQKKAEICQAESSAKSVDNGVQLRQSAKAPSDEAGSGKQEKPFRTGE